MPYDPEQLAIDVEYLTTLPQWQDEAKRPEFIRRVALQAGPNLDPQAHGEFANALWERSKGNLLQRGAEFVARGGEEVLKSIPASGGAAVFAASDALGITDTGSGTRLKRGVADLVDATGQRLKQLGGGEILGMNLLPGQSKQAVRDQTLDALKQSLDQGLYPAGLERWMTGEFDAGDVKPDAETQQWIDLMTRGIAERAVAADHMGKVKPEKVREWLQSDRNPAFARSDIPGEPGPRELLADYLATRDPSSWEAFQARVSETDSQRTTRLRRFAAEGEMRATTATMPEGLGKDLAVRSMDMQTSPIDLATAALPIFRGRAALQAARGGRVAQVARGMGSEALQEGATEYLSDPNASPGRVLEAAALGAVGQGVISAPMAGAGALLQRRDSLSNDLPPPQQTPAPTPAPATNPPAAPAPGLGASPPPGLEEDLGDLTAEDVADLAPATPPLTPTPTLPPQTQGVGGGVRGGEGATVQPDAGVGQTMSDPITGESAIGGLQTQEVPVNALQLSADVPQFKSDANEQGVVEPLAGRYERMGTGPILVWERLDGRREVISGRHRFDLAKRTGEATIPAQVVREADGFSLAQAITADAELNIRDGHGKTKDFANYFRNSGITDTEADARGLRARAAQRAGWIIGTQGSPAVFDLHANGQLTDAQAEALARTAPGNEALQRAGVLAMNRGRPIDVTVNLLKAMQAEMGAAPTPDQMDLFGADDSAIARMEEQASKATEIQRGLKEQVAAVQGAAKRPDKAKALGVNVKDPQGVQKKVDAIRAELYRWESWPLHADLREQVRGAEIPTALPPPPPPTLPPQPQGVEQGMSDPFASLLSGTESTRPRNRGETARPQNADPLGELQSAKLAGEANQAQGRMEPLMSPANRLGRGLADLMPGQVPSSKSQVPSSRPLETSNLKPETLSAAYATAARGSSTAMIPLAEVFAAAQAANPALTQEQFQAQVMSDYEAGSLMLEGAGSLQEAQSAGLRIDGTPVGTAVRMMVPQGFKNLDTSGRTAGFLNTDILAEATDLIRNGITDFANWSRAMVQRFGAAIREFLTGIWQQITSPQTNAAQNVRMGRAQGTAPVTLGQGGFVNGPQQSTPNETQSRFASPNPADRVIDGPRTDELVTAEANAWLGSMDQQAAIEAFVAGQVPLSLDTAERAAATLIANLSEQAATAKTEMARMWAHVQGRRMARVWTTEHLSADPARALRQRGVVNNTILAPIAPVLAAQELLEDRAKKVIDQRFDGGTEGAVEKVKDIATKADEQAGTELAADLEGETTPGAPTRPGQPPRPRKLGAKHPNLKKMLDALRKKMFPGMSWADIFTQLPESQKARQREIYRRLMLDERLRNLTAEERLALTNELDKAWQRERRKVFMRELDKAKVLGEKDKKDREKVKAATPRLLRLMNLGMLNSDLFREALAQEYGVRQITPAIAAELRTLGERIQTAPEGLPRRKLEQQLVEKLQSLVDATLWQTLDSYWTASVLSGWRTQVDIGLSLANGIEDVGLGSVVTAIRTGNKDVAVRALGALFGRIPSAFMEAVDHIATGNKAMMRNFELEAKQAMEGGNRLASDVGAAMWKRGGWRKVPGAFMVFYGRLLTALDHINSASTREGALAMALARHPELYQRALRITPADRAAARKQARQELTLGTAPATRQQRLEEDARVREILEQGTPPELLDEALEVGRRAALQGEPTGIGGTLLDAVLSAVDVVNRKATELAGRENADAITKQGAKVTGALVPFVRALTGTKFARTVAHALNRNLSYVPGVGFYAVGQQGRTGAFADILMARQIIGTLVGIAAYLAFDDDEDEKGIEDGWKDKTPQQKAQLYAQGKQPFTVWGRDAQGRVVSYNYQQWGIAGILNTVAAMLKQKDSEAGTMNVLTNSLIQGAMSFTDKAQLQGLQTVFGDNYRSTDPASGIASNLNKWAAQTVGGLVPRIAKDIDNELSPELRDTSQWWQRWAKEVPVLRELSSGKRVNILGEDIKLDRGPFSRVRQVGTADPAYRTLGLLNSRDIYLPDPSTGVHIVRLADGTRRPMTPQEKDRYQRLTGQSYRQLLNEKGPQLLQMDPEDAKDYILKTTKRLRDRAAVQAVK